MTVHAGAILKQKYSDCLNSGRHQKYIRADVKFTAKQCPVYRCPLNTPFKVLVCPHDKILRTSETAMG